MKTIRRSRFMRWLAEKRIGVDAEFAADWPRNLAFQGAPSESRFWSFDGSAEQVLEYFEAVLDAVGRDDSFFLWAKDEAWLPTRSARSGEAGDALWRAVLHPLRTCRHDGAIEFTRGDRDQLLGILYCAHTFGWTWSDDLYLVPASRLAVVMLDHHDAVWIETASADDMRSVIARMSERGFQLPTALPDSTFKPQAWMKPGSDGPAATGGPTRTTSSG